MACVAVPTTHVSYSRGRTQEVWLNKDLHFYQLIGQCNCDLPTISTIWPLVARTSETLLVQILWNDVYHTLIMWNIILCTALPILWSRIHISKNYLFVCASCLLSCLPGLCFLQATICTGRSFRADHESSQETLCSLPFFLFHSRVLHFSRQESAIFAFPGVLKLPMLQLSRMDLGRLVCSKNSIP